MCVVYIILTPRLNKHRKIKHLPAHSLQKIHLKEMQSNLIHNFPRIISTSYLCVFQNRIVNFSFIKSNSNYILTIPINLLPLYLKIMTNVSFFQLK